MPTPTLIIGIGTSGLYTLEHVQRFYYETFAANKPPHVEYLYIETNKDNLVGVTPLPNEIHRVYVSLGEMEKMVNELRKEGCGDWLPPSNQLVNAGLGAGGMRSCGRLALWGSNSEADNFKQVVEAINYSYAQIVAHANQNRLNQKPTVFITGSFTGGTGSGIFIDMAYLIRYLIRDIKELFGLFLLPPQPASIRRLEVLYANTYSALKDLDHYNQVETIYREEWPNGVHADYEIPPYELVQFISQDCHDGPAMRNLNALYKMAGLYLFLNIIGMKEIRMERLVDAKAAGHIDKYGTFGLSAIQFPKDQIQEYLALSLGIELIERWTDSSQYLANNNKKPINKAVIMHETIKQFDEIIENSFSILNSVGGRNLVSEIEREANEINSKSIKGHPVDYISNMFKSTNDRNYYSLVKNNIQSALDNVIESIHDLIVKVLDETENLTYTLYKLESLNQAIINTIEYWTRLRLTSNSESWENVLKDLLDDTLKQNFKEVLEHDSVLKEKLLNIFETMKMHLIIRGLNGIANNIVKEDVPLKSTVLNKELPKTQTIEGFIRKLSEVTGRIETQDRIFTFDKRSGEIRQDVSDETIPILRIFPSGSFSQETENAKRIYQQRTRNTERTKEEIVRNMNLWDYLTRRSRARFHYEVYSDCIKGYRNSIKDTECVPDFDVARYIIEHPEQGINYARRSASPFISLDRILENTTLLPKFIAGGDINAIRDVVAIFTHNNYGDFPDRPDRTKELPDLRNILIFYCEYGNFNLLEDLTYIMQMKDVYENPPNNIPKDRWLNMRNTYKY